MTAQEQHRAREDYEQLQYFIRRQSVVNLLKKKGIKYFFPIQYETFDSINYGSDIIGRDRTGSGKTVAYSLPILERLRDQQQLNQDYPKPKFLIVLPTRELTIQVKNQIQSLKIHPKEFRILAIYGGTPIGMQLDYIRQGVDIIAATPGRLIDVLQRKAINLQQLQSVCLDQADEMLKQGFQEDVEMIFEYINKNCPRKTQKLLFSATVPRWVEDLSNKFMSRTRKFIDLIKNYEIKTSKTIEHLCLCANNDRRTMNDNIANLIRIYAGTSGSVIIFCETKRQANQLNASLNLKQLKNMLHGDVPQHIRQQTFRNFKNGIVKCLIATNVAARGLDIPSVDLIIQLQPPRKVDDYVHRAGRTGRAGKNGVCVTFFSKRDSYLMKEIQKMANIRFRQIAEPKNIDIIKASSREIVTKIKNLDEGVVEYFEDIAKELIAEMGAQKALSLALAQLSGVKTKIQEISMQTKIPGYMTYIFSTEGESVNQKDLIEFLKCRLERFGQQDIYQPNFLTSKSIVFDVRENLKKKMQEVILDLQKKENILESIYRLRTVTNQEMLKNFSDQEVEFTSDEYENAVHNRNQYEVVVKGFDRQIDEDILFRFFKTHAVKVVQIKMLRDDRGMNKGIAFVLCLNPGEKEKALSLSGLVTLQNRSISIDLPNSRR